MKIFLIGICLIMSAFFGESVPMKALAKNHQFEQQREPAYAKWERAAVKGTKKKYPQAQVIDYKRLGRTTINKEFSEERFKLWLKEGEKAFIVHAVVVFTNQDHQVMTIRFTETKL